MASSDSVEHDSESSNSFLDVITNSIGILIILVMVAGQRAKDVASAMATAPLNAELVAAQAETNTLEQDVNRISAQMTTVQAELAGRGAERGQLSTLVAAMEGELAQRRAALGEQSRRNYDLQRDMALARDQLSRLEAEREQTDKTALPETVQVESYPTPISKTVDGKEMHFQLMGGRVTFVPFEALIDQLRASMREYASKLQDQGDMTDTLGPISGFRLRYGIERHDSRQGGYLQVSHIELIPTSSQLGEPLDMALAAKSNFRNKLEMMSPRQYTITVWTYPDSFAEFRRLKKELYGMGYAVAGRPLPDGMPIGASPSGSKSSAQ